MHGSDASTTDVFAPPTSQMLQIPLFPETGAKDDRHIASKHTQACNLLQVVGLNTPLPGTHLHQPKGGTHMVARGSQLSVCCRCLDVSSPHCLLHTHYVPHIAQSPMSSIGLHGT